MENKKNCKKIQSNYKDNLSCVEKLIKYQEKLFNVIYRNGKWVRKYNDRENI